MEIPSQIVPMIFSSFWRSLGLLYHVKEWTAVNRVISFSLMSPPFTPGNKNIFHIPPKFFSFYILRNSLLGTWIFILLMWETHKVNKHIRYSRAQVRKLPCYSILAYSTEWKHNPVVQLSLSISPCKCNTRMHYLLTGLLFRYLKWFTSSRLKSLKEWVI